MKNPILRETSIIVFWSFLSSAGIGLIASLILRWPITATYLMAVLTIGPALAVLRGRVREKDPLELSERAGVEILALLILLGLGWAAARWLGQ